MKILAFCFFPAFTPPTNGGQSRLLNFYIALSQRHEVTLLTSTHTGEKEERVIHGVGFAERRIPRDDYFVQQYALLNRYASGGDLSGPAIAACGEFPTRLHQAYLEEYENADVIIHDGPFTTDYDLFAGVDQKLRIYNSYNCEALLYRQLHPAEQSRPIHDVVQQAELRMLEKADLVFYCNGDDLTTFREMRPQARFEALYVPNGTTPVGAGALSSEKPYGRFSAVFMGSGHPPNVQAADFIVNKLAPQLPDVDFEFIGSCLSDGRYPANVHRHGMVSDEIKLKLLGRASLALNPMTEGSGSNVKVLDYFAHCLPVLSTSLGMRGIKAEVGVDYLEAELEQFANVIRFAKSQPSFMDKVAQAGKALAIGQYTWDIIAGIAARAIENMLAAKCEFSPGYILALNDYDSFESTGGGGTRTRGLYTAVSEWCPVVFVSFSEVGRLQTRQYVNGITVINVPKSSEHLIELQQINAQSYVSTSDIIASRHCVANPFLNFVYRILRQRARCIVVEHCYMVPLPSAWGDRFVYSSQNHEAELKGRLLKGHPLQAELLRDVECLERFAVERSAVTIAVSREDAESLLKGKRSAGPVIVVRNGASSPAHGDAVQELKARLSDQIGERAVVFLGSAHMPNIEAANFIANQIAPSCKDVRFHLIGSVCDVMVNVPRNIKLWGVVDDDTKSAVMQSCSLAINPMFSGSGSNVKLADYIGNGLFVVTTEFGQRGYPVSVHEHIAIAKFDSFVDTIKQTLNQPNLQSDQARKSRQVLFQSELSMHGLARRFVDTLQGMEVKRKRILYVGYRYITPALGGAEVNLEKFVYALGHSGKFDVDVVAPEVSALHSFWRFGEHYTFDPELSAPVDIPNVRFARFLTDAPDKKEMFARLRHAWQVQPRFERALSEQFVTRYAESGLAWGWGSPESETGQAKRWAFTECGLYLAEQAAVTIDGFTPGEAVITAYSCGVMIAGPLKVKGRFKLEFVGPTGEIFFATSTSLQPADPRPLGFNVSHLRVAGVTIDLALPDLIQRHLSKVSAETSFLMLDRAAETTRKSWDISLTDSRGPWSKAMEAFIANHVAEYDLVVTNNNVFRPAVVAIAEAKRRGVSSIVIPHAHLDDDFYHFPDWLQSVRDASLVLAAPKAVVSFLEKKQCNVRYLPAGCDAAEEFTNQDIEAFHQVFLSGRQFILVLGRKAGAKGYRKIISAVDQLNSAGEDLHVVLIGPDDDGLPVSSPNATYLGRQPRNVVRGALQSCLALCNMSMSESFGIVLLEAWLAGKPVIANRGCAAFHDMAIDGENALLVDDDSLAEAIMTMVSQPEMRKKFGESGKQVTKRFHWDAVCEQFVSLCSDLAGI